MDQIVVPSESIDHWNVFIILYIESIITIGVSIQQIVLSIKLKLTYGVSVTIIEWLIVSEQPNISVTIIVIVVSPGDIYVLFIVLLVVLCIIWSPKSQSHIFRFPPNGGVTIELSVNAIGIFTQ